MAATPPAQKPKRFRGSGSLPLAAEQLANGERRPAPAPPRRLRPRAARHFEWAKPWLTRWGGDPNLPLRNACWDACLSLLPFACAMQIKLDVFAAPSKER